MGQQAPVASAVAAAAAVVVVVVVVVAVHCAPCADSTCGFDGGGRREPEKSMG